MTQQMDADKVVEPVAVAAASVIAPAAAAAAVVDGAATITQIGEVKEEKKARGGKRSKGQPKAAKAPKAPKDPKNPIKPKAEGGKRKEGVPKKKSASMTKPAASRIFKEAPSADKMRMSADTMNTMQTLLKHTTSRLALESLATANKFKRKTIYADDVMAVATKDFPRSKLFTAYPIADQGIKYIQYRRSKPRASSRATAEVQSAVAVSA